MKISKGQITRNRIIAVATDLFMSEGLYNVTFQQIANGAEVTQPAIYRHFKDMDDLILESCKHWITEFKEYKTEPVEELLLANLQLKQFLDRHLIYASKNRAQDGLLFGLYYYSMRSKKMLEFYKEVKLRAMNRIKLILLQGNVDGSWKIADIESIANTIHSLIVGEIIKILIEPRLESQQERTARVYAHVLLLLKGT